MAAGSDVALTKLTSSVNVSVGTRVTYTLRSNFTGDSPQNLTLTDTLPGSVTLDAGTFAAAQNGWSCSAVGQTVTCTRANGGGVAGFQQNIGDVVIPVIANTAGAGVVNTANIATTSSDPNLANNTASSPGVTIVNPSADLSAGKSQPNPALAVVGIPYNYGLSVTNSGPSNMSGAAVLTDNIPTGLTVNSITLNGWACQELSGGALVALALPRLGPFVLSCARNFTVGSPLAINGTSASAVVNVTATAPGVITN